MKNTSSKGDVKEQGDYQLWAFPKVSGAGGATAARTHNDSADNRSDKRKEEEAYRAGFARGRADGMSAAQEEIRRRVNRLDQIIDFLSLPMQALDSHVEQELAGLAIDIARQIVRREIKLDSGHVVAVVREAIAALPLSSEMLSIHLHPEDAITVREALSLSESEQRCRVVEDPVIGRGGCRISSSTSQVDATIEQQIAAISARIFGGERDADSNKR